MENATGQRDPQTYAIIGACMEVHRELGHGFLEAVYHEALQRELKLRDVPFRHEVELPVSYKGESLICSYKCNLLCFEDIVVEIKAISRLTSGDEAQLINYLKASSIQRGILINFGTPSLQYKRLIRTHIGQSAFPSPSSSI